MKYDFKQNIIILGETNVGKTTLIYNYLYTNLDLHDNITTIGIDYYKKVLHDNNNSYLLNIYDTGNGLLYKNILEFYLRKSNIFIIVLKDKTYKFVKEVFEFINTDTKIKPKHIFIVYNKLIDNCDFTFNENEIIKYNTTYAKLHFSYINILSKYDVNMFFNYVSQYIYKINNNNNNSIEINKSNNIYKKKLKKLMPLNKDNESIGSKSYSCNCCCIIS